MCIVLLPPGDNPIAVDKYIKCEVYYVINYTALLLQNADSQID